MDYKGEKNFWGFLYMYQVIIFRFKRNRAKTEKILPTQMQKSCIGLVKNFI